MTNNLTLVCGVHFMSFWAGSFTFADYVCFSVCCCLSVLQRIARIEITIAQSTVGPSAIGTRGKVSKVCGDLLWSVVVCGFQTYPGTVGGRLAQY